jgi:uncharacterized Tic20 family protein
MGVIAPILIWATQKDKSPYIAFQALQAAAYQITLVLLWFLGMGCYMCSFFGFFFLIPGSAILADGNEAWLPLFGLPIFFPFVVIGTMMLAMLLFVVYGLVAAVLVLQGRPFRYALIAGWIDRYLARPSPSAD